MDKPKLELLQTLRTCALNRVHAESMRVDARHASAAAELAYSKANEACVAASQAYMDAFDVLETAIKETEK